MQSINTQLDILAAKGFRARLAVTIGLEGRIKTILAVCKVQKPKSEQMSIQIVKFYLNVLH